MNYLGDVRICDYVLLSTVLLAPLTCGVWVFVERKKHVVRVMQPMFLGLICVGAASLSIVPFGLNDEHHSTRGCDIKCMAAPNLLSIGFNIALEAFFAKLMRANK